MKCEQQERGQPDLAPRSRETTESQQHFNREGRAARYLMAPPGAIEAPCTLENASPHDEELHGENGVTHEGLSFSVQPKILDISTQLSVHDAFVSGSLVLKSVQRSLNTKCRI